MNALREERNWDRNESVGLSTWMLKSPVRTNSWGVVAMTERKELNSSRKALGFAEQADELAIKLMTERDHKRSYIGGFLVQTSKGIRS